MPGSTRGLKDAASRVETRHRMEARRRAVPILIVVAVVVLVAGAVWAVWFSDWFVVRSVEVTGNSQVTTQAVIDAAQVGVGTPLVSLDVTAIRARVAALPAVADATIGRDLSGVVHIGVTERTAVYVIPQAGQYLLVDGTGVGFLTATTTKGLPVVKLSDTTSAAGQRLMADAAVIAQALPTPVRSAMTSMTAETPDTFTIDLKDGSQVFWGSADQSDLKAQVISGLLKVDASYYDVSSPSHPATR